VQAGWDIRKQGVDGGPDRQSRRCDSPPEPPRGPLPGCSLLRFDLGSEGLGCYFPIPHNKRVRCEFVRIVCCFRSPENIGVIAIDASLLHRERGARLCKLRNEALEEGPDCVLTS
jgi:hypothetical protein